MARQLSSFNPSGYDKGRNLVWQLAWLVIWGSFGSRWWCPNRVRIALLRAFGASIGQGVNFRHGVKVHWPWKLAIGHNSWIGEQVWILNLEKVAVGSNVCISQGVLLCAGSHRADLDTFDFDNGPIVIEDGVWLCARSVVLRGVLIGANSVVGACAVVDRDLRPSSKVYGPRAQGAT